MPHNHMLIYAGLVGAIGIAAFVGSALSYMRSVNAISAFLKSEYPAAWHLIFQGDMPAGFVFEPGKDVESLSISWIIGGLQRLGLTDPRYVSLLWIARRRLILCAVLFVASVWALGWITRGGGASLFR